MTFRFAGMSMIAQEDAMIRRMMADIDAVMEVRDPGVYSLGAGGVSAFAPGTGVVVTSVSTGGGTCSQTISCAYPGNGRPPHVTMSSTGGGCGAIGSPRPPEVLRTLPKPPQVVPAQHERLWSVGYPPHPRPRGVPPGT
jgi:hypothetical protein